jgi:pantoate--beta-alanine ligase
VNVARTIAELHEALAPSHRSSVGLVPTMGALHAGHAALFAAARAESDVVVASVFVNPAQFTELVDFDAYPRDLDADAAYAAAAGVDLVFAPDADVLYPAGFATWVDPAGAAEGLEGDARPGHFRGVATVCVKLFNLVRPQKAYFGRKDAQQIAVLRQVVRDLNLDVDIRAVETVRDADGLALSSRNSRLAPDERARAAQAIGRALATGDPGRARDVLLAAGLEPEYVAVADLDGPTLALATRVGGTRLIDNVRLQHAFAANADAATTNPTSTNDTASLEGEPV